MTALNLFTAAADLIPAAIDGEFGKRDACILATRLAIEVAAAFGIGAQPLSVRVALLNGAFAKHVKDGDADVRKWASIDGSHSVGIGFGFKPGQDTTNRWNGHLIAAADGVFGDFAIRQAERPEKGILTGSAIVGPWREPRWTVIDPESGTTLYYERIKNILYRFSPDWRDEMRRRKLAGPIIRKLRRRL
jgi:hypothetical protein